MEVRGVLIAYVFCLIEHLVESGLKRQITETINPQCEDYPSCRNNTCNIVYIRAQGDSDSLIYVISTLGFPSILVLRTGDKNPNIKIDWDKIGNGTLEKSIQFNFKPLSVYSVVFPKVYEYSDHDDKADLNAYSSTMNDTWNSYDLGQIRWQAVVNTTNNDIHTITFTSEQQQWMCGNVTHSFPCTGKYNQTGTFSFSYHIYQEDGRENNLPHLEHNSNMTGMDFVINNIKPMDYAKSRFALELVFLSSSKEKSSIHESKLIDDEYTPGVFKITDWTATSTGGGYIQWKPVFYYEEGRDRTVASKVKHYDFVQMNSSEIVDKLQLNNSLPFYYYGMDISKQSMDTTNVSFGLGKDKFYPHTNYTAWTISIGYGEPPVDKVSEVIIIVIAVGLGLPVVIIIFGGIFVCIKKRKQSGLVVKDVTTDYSKIN